MDPERRIESFLGPQSRVPVSRSTLAFVERRFDTVSNDDSPINAIQRSQRSTTDLDRLHQVDVTVVDKLHSDHLPVNIRIRNKPNDPATNTITTTDEQIERTTLDYENRIRASIDATSIRRPARPFKRPALPQRIANLIREKNKARGTARRTGERGDQTAANGLQWEVRQALFNLKNEQWEQRLESFKNQSIWKMAKALKSDKRPLRPIHSANNGIVFTDEDKTAAFAYSLENQGSTNIDLDVDDEHMDLVGGAVEELRSAERNEDTLIRATDPDQIRGIIRNLKPRKAPSPEHIPKFSRRKSSDRLSTPPGIPELNRSPILQESRRPPQPCCEKPSTTSSTKKPPKSQAGPQCAARGPNWGVRPHAVSTDRSLPASPIPPPHRIRRTAELMPAQGSFFSVSDLQRRQEPTAPLCQPKKHDPGERDKVLVPKQKKEGF
ncbi:hypothetical protein Zmor_006756 [Zophobas morio]|uniref:Uncharacterized protein n=1 Tax=Zophobas morio TaxID=2755281 RepID=A0AA38MLP9_9CUCU|nr:hypothetical protein Zmor_006756 [Zophobas morio]